MIFTPSGRVYAISPPVMTINMDQILDFKQMLSAFFNLTAAQLKFYQRVPSIRKMQYTVCL